MHSEFDLPGHISEPPAQGVIQVPYQRLSDEALTGIIEEFISREGTDYGDYGFSFADKKAQVMQQLEKDIVVILFDPSTETCTLALKTELKGYF